MLHSTQSFPNVGSLTDYVLSLSQSDRGAFIAVARPFSHITDIHRFANPSSIPDHFVDMVAQLPDRAHCVAFRGQLRGFTPATVVRDQNRAMGNR